MDHIITHCHACHDMAWSGLEITLIRQLYYVRYAKQPHLAPHLSPRTRRTASAFCFALPLRSDTKSNRGHSLKGENDRNPNNFRVIKNLPD